MTTLTEACDWMQANDIVSAYVPRHTVPVVADGRITVTQYARAASSFSIQWPTTSA